MHFQFRVPTTIVCTTVASLAYTFDKHISNLCQYTVQFFNSCLKSSINDYINNAAMRTNERGHFLVTLS
jgi:hypothetical protein